MKLSRRDTLKTLAALPAFRLKAQAPSDLEPTLSSLADHVLDEATVVRKAATRAHILGVFDRLAKAHNGRVFGVS